MTGGECALADRERLPSLPAVFVIIGDGDRMLFIGETHDLRARLVSQRTHGEIILRDPNATVYWTITPERADRVARVRALHADWRPVERPIICRRPL